MAALIADLAMPLDGFAHQGQDGLEEPNPPERGPEGEPAGGTGPTAGDVAPGGPR